jgi:cell division septal protein FtsQ
MQNAPNIDDIEYIDLRYPNGFALKGRSKLDNQSAAGLKDVSECNRHA